jgi:class 3 adenylate cyclase
MVAFMNRSHRRLTFILEDPAWCRDALTAHRVTTLQAFRDLFNDDVLRAGDNVEIDSISFLFTDLKQSTTICDQIGDAQVYALVREYFDILSDAVTEHDGSIVKKNGDAVMAVFFNPVDALTCAIRVQHDIQWFNHTSDNDPIIVKLGLHTGRCLAVNVNDRLEYYGSAVNLATALQGQSRGGDIVMSAQFTEDPQVALVLDGYSPVAQTAWLPEHLKSISFWRLTAEEFTAHGESRN